MICRLVVVYLHASGGRSATSAADISMDYSIVVSS